VDLASQSGRHPCTIPFDNPVSMTKQQIRPEFGWL
jgi:hypothetical protein